MPSNVPGSEDEEKRPIPKKDASSSGLDKEAVNGIIGRLRGRKTNLPTNTESPTTRMAWEVKNLVSEMQKLGLEPAGLGKFIASLHKLAVASGVEPGILASIIEDLSLLSGGKHVSMDQIRKKIKQLSDEKKDLAQKVSELQARKDSLDVELSLKELDNASTKKSWSDFLQVQEKLGEVGVSIDDLSKLASMVTSAKELGHSPSALINLLADTKSAQERKTRTEAEIDQLLGAKRTTLQKGLALDQELAEKQKLIESADILSKLGFGTKELDDLSAAVKMIAKTRNIDEATARERLIFDIQSYYANDQELRRRVRTLESLLQEKEEKFNMLEADYRNEKAVLENASKLISSGLNEQWLVKLQTILDSYGLDIDALAQDLQSQEGLRTSIDVLARTKKALEEEEMLLRQKVVAAEDQRVKTLALINNLIINRRPISQNQESAAQNKAASEDAGSADFLVAAQKTVELIREKLRKDSPARLVLEHALLALKLESNRRS